MWVGLNRSREDQWNEAGWGLPSVSSFAEEHLGSEPHQLPHTPSPTQPPSLSLPLYCTITPHTLITHSHLTHTPHTLPFTPTLIISLCRRWPPDGCPVGLAVERDLLHILNLLPVSTATSHHITTATPTPLATHPHTPCPSHSQLVENVPQKAVHLQPLQGCVVPADRALPGTAVAVHL